LRGFNKVILVGNLARDPEVRYTASKQAVARFSVAVNRQWKGQNGEVQEQVDFIPVVVWGAQAENCERYLAKGRGVLVEGRLSIRSYEKDGQKRSATEVVAQSVQFLGGARREGDEGRPVSRSGEGFESAPRSGQVASLRDEKGFEEFPLDISEMGGDSEEADIPF